MRLSARLEVARRQTAKGLPYRGEPILTLALACYGKKRQPDDKYKEVLQYPYMLFIPYPARQSPPFQRGAAEDKMETDAG